MSWLAASFDLSVKRTRGDRWHGLTGSFGGVGSTTKFPRDTGCGRAPPFFPFVNGDGTGAGRRLVSVTRRRPTSVSV